MQYIVRRRARERGAVISHDPAAQQRFTIQLMELFDRCVARPVLATALCVFALIALTC
jgi:hypothetical protein